MNKALTEYTPKAYLTGEACLAPTIAPKARTLNLRSLTCFQVFSLASARLCRDEARLARRIDRIDIKNNHNTCATHTAGESGFAPTNYDYQYFIPICVGFYSFVGVAGNAPATI